MDKEVLEIIMSQQETIKMLAMELSGLANALGQSLVQTINSTTGPVQRLDFGSEVDIPEESLPSTEAGVL